MKYSKGSKVLFITKHCETPYSGQEAEVMDNYPPDGTRSCHQVQGRIPDERN